MPLKGLKGIESRPKIQGEDRLTLQRTLCVCEFIFVLLGMYIKFDEALNKK